MDRECWGIYLDLVDDVEGIGISLIREDDFHQGVCNVVPAIGRSFERIMEVCCGILNRSVAPKNDKTSDADALILRSANILSRYSIATYKTRVMTLTMPMPLDSRKPARVLKARTGYD